jgi:hypothetical protein
VQFDLALLVSHYFSVVVHCIELLAKSPYLTGGVPYADWYGMVRAPRPFIVVRLIRSVLRFKLPQNRIQIIIKCVSNRFFSNNNNL